MALVNLFAIFVVIEQGDIIIRQHDCDVPRCRKPLIAIDVKVARCVDYRCNDFCKVHGRAFSKRPQGSRWAMKKSALRRGNVKPISNDQSECKSRGNGCIHPPEFGKSVGSFACRVFREHGDPNLIDCQDIGSKRNSPAKWLPMHPII